MGPKNSSLICRYSLGAIAVGMLAFAQSARAGDFSVTQSSIPGCRNGQAIVATFDFNQAEFREKFQLQVITGKSRTRSAVQKDLERSGRPVAALINAGFFFGTAPVSFYKSSINGRQHSSNSAMSPRACLVHESKTAQTQLLQSTEAHFRMFIEAKDIEVYCAGPQLVSFWTDVSSTQFCRERFHPDCRSDHQDPGVGYWTNVPRTGSCVTSKGELKWFSLNSSTHRCGGTLPDLTGLMMKEDCVDGMNHDGGGSSKLYLDPAQGSTVVADGIENRAVPVWVAIVRRSAK